MVKCSAFNCPRLFPCFTAIILIPSVSILNISQNSAVIYFFHGQNPQNKSPYLYKYHKCVYKAQKSFDINMV